MRQTVVKAVCDRCGKTETGYKPSWDSSSPPKDWAQVHFERQGDRLDCEWDLCPGCEAWLRCVIDHNDTEPNADS